MKRVVVTGIGMVTPLGGDVLSSWHNLLLCKSGIRSIPSSFSVTYDLATQIAGLVPGADEPDGLDLEKYISRKELSNTSRFIHFAIASAEQAIQDAGWLPKTEEEHNRAGVLIGSGIGGLITIEHNASVLLQNGPRRISPFFIPASLINLASGYISIRYNLKGPNHAVVTACATGAHAIGDAARIISCGDADVMVCGGTEAPVCRLGIAGFAAMRALSTRNSEPELASRPWDKRRDGFVMAEGAGVLVLEELEHARRRGAKMYGELIGYGLTGDANHVTAPDPIGDGGYRAMHMAINKAGITPNEISYINAHGTSTPTGDIVELYAIKRLFGDAINTVSVSSTKSSTGHLLGAAGSVEAIFGLLALRNSVMPATLNLDDVDEQCRGVDLIPYTPKEQKIDIVMSNSFGFGGTNVSLIFRKI